MSFIPTSEGHVQLLRKLLNSRIWKETSPREKTILITLLLMTHPEPYQATFKGKEITVKPGSIVATVEDIAYLAGKDIGGDDILAAIEVFGSEPYGFLEYKIKRDILTELKIKILKWKKYNQGGLSNEETEQRKADAEKLYRFYIEKIEPVNKSKARAMFNILKHMKKYDCKSLARAVLNYRIKAISYDPSYRKNPANFFGTNEPYFKDFLPETFEQTKKEGLHNSNSNDTNDSRVPPVLTPDRLRELNT